MILCLVFGMSGCKSEENKQELPEITMEILVLSPNRDTDIIEQAVNEYIEKKINCRVKLKEVTIDEHENKLYQMNKNDYMDIIYCGYTTSPFELQNRGILMGLQDLLKNYGKDLYKKCGVLMEGCYFNHDYYFIPGNLYPCSSNAIIYNQKLFDKYHIEIDTTETDVYNIIDKLGESIKNSDYNGYPFSNGDGYATYIPTLNIENFGDSEYYSYGVLKDVENSTEIINIYEDEDFYNYCLLMRSWYEKGYLMNDSLTTDKAVVSDLMSENIMFSNNQASSDIYQMRTVSGGILSAYMLTKPVLQESSVVGQSIGISAYSQYPEKCMELLNLIYTDPQLSNLLTYGIEGRHYIKKSEHTIAYPENTDDGSVGYEVVGTIGDAGLNYVRTPISEEDYKKITTYSPDQAVRSNAFGYVFDPRNVMMQVSAVQDVVSRYRPGLMCGVVDVDDIMPQFLQALKDAGIDEIIEENQRQFDLWKNNK